MASVEVEDKKPHAVCILYPAQGHMSSMLKVAKILHCKGFHISFVNTEFNHKRLVTSLQGFPHHLHGLPSSDDTDATQDIPALSQSTSSTCLVPFRNLLSKLNAANDIPPVTCIVSDSSMSFYSPFKLLSKLESLKYCSRRPAPAAFWLICTIPI
ncbi:hypothetical protein NE237_019443 [Protea cynaroides]|uniref:Uncharacterized protein n=1 Tax=Protea cynaroides TaxID=273540 RepID=A0A9Q0KBW3_9MAGN|nr:hypothetical protein NE237_019443 [Protea cynaroides]